MTKTEQALSYLAIVSTSRDLAQCTKALRGYKSTVLSLAKTTGRTYDQVDAELKETLAESPHKFIR